MTTLLWDNIRASLSRKGADRTTGGVLARGERRGACLSKERKTLSRERRALSGVSLFER